MSWGGGLKLNRTVKRVMGGLKLNREVKVVRQRVKVFQYT